MGINSIAIVGGGPAGCALAAYLAKAGLKTSLFFSGKRPELVVGESLIPQVVQHLRELGIEDEVSSYATYKPGATFFISPDECMKIDFSDQGILSRSSPGYAYNVPREKFDKTLLETAKNAGTKLINKQINLNYDQNKDRVELEASVQKELGHKPDFIVDASGRRRLLPRLASISATAGKRKDIALFAHMKNVLISDPGNIHVNRFEWGWTWRIPLPKCVSVGIVANQEFIKRSGSSNEEQFDEIIKKEPLLNGYTDSSERLTDVMRYSNYQLVSDRYFGKNWALIGDSAGFVDPVFSSGLTLCLTGAHSLSKAIIFGGGESRLTSYEREMRSMVRNWQAIAESFYNGKLLGTARAALRTQNNNFVKDILSTHCKKHMMRVFSGTEFGGYGHMIYKVILNRLPSALDIRKMQIQ